MQSIKLLFYSGHNFLLSKIRHINAKYIRGNLEF
uniref:Uncharacterized protein n=1 Tax=Anguilla anguilla TaxID=7936 RepID=A0A0E9VM10_ANGAN